MSKYEKLFSRLYDEAMQSTVHHVFHLTRDELIELLETGRPMRAKEYAGVIIWIGDRTVTNLVTEEIIKYERDKGGAITEAAQVCLNKVLEGQS